MFQLHVRGDGVWVDDHVRRALGTGYDAFCIKVDSALYSRRKRDIASLIGRHGSISFVRLSP